MPSCRHLYIDDVWRELGQAAGCLRYLPNVTFEHMHPAVNKAEWDDGYVRANSDLTVQADRAAYLAWMGVARAGDAEAVERVLRAA